MAPSSSIGPGGRAALLAALALAALALPDPAAEAARMRRPFGASIGVNYGRDNYGGTGCDDYQCGGYCYDGHSGTDFPLPLGTEVVAAFAGQVTATYNGCANYGGLGNTCGGRCGNYVRIQHTDGTAILYCHLQLNSITVSTGQWVSCGQAVGRSASSGNSTGPHLHLGYYVGGASRDPFSGPCSQGTSHWMSQGTYPHPIPSATCESSCACSPGQTESQGCGNCGTRSRTCGSDCQWGSWSGCGGEGPCAPGQQETRPCCDCGQESRTCQGNCQWGGWGACGGPDPAGAPDCDTGEPGVCAAGRQRCVDGCLACARLVEPSPERCDEIDNDCSGVADDGSPQTMGDPPPRYAARLVDLSVPRRLAPGERAEAWAVFENVGREPWPAGALWLQALAPGEGAGSRLADAEAWLAHDVAAVLHEDVPPAGFGEVVFALRLDPGARSLVTERFRLLGPEGVPIRCPSSELEVAVAPARATAAELPGLVDAGAPRGAPATPGPEVVGGCQCRTGGSATPGAFALFAALLLGGWLGARRRRAAHPGRVIAGRRPRREGPRHRTGTRVLRSGILPLLVAAVVLAATSCVEEPPGGAGRAQRAATGGAPLPSEGADPAPAPAPSLSAADPEASAVARAHAALKHGETLLAASDDGRRVVGRLRAVPPRTSAWRILDARLLLPTGAVLDLPVPGGAIQEARFAPGPGGALALIDRQDRLWLLKPAAPAARGARDGAAARTGLGRGPSAPVLVDHPVLPGVSFSPDGASLAYVQGAVPELRLRRYDLAAGRHFTVVPGGPPLALPAFSPDGRRLVFASAREGVPALYGVGTDGRGLARLTDPALDAAAFRAGQRGVPMPEGARPPLWLGDRVIFEAKSAVLAVDAVRGTLLWRLPGADWPHLGPAGPVVRLGGPRGAFHRVLAR